MFAALSIGLTALIVLGLVAAGDDTRPYLKAAVDRLVSLRALGNQKGSGTHCNFDSSVSQHNAAVVAATLCARTTNIALKPLDILTAATYDESGIERTLSNIRYLGDPKALQEMETVLGDASPIYWERFKSDQLAAELTCGAFTKQGYFRPLSLAEVALKPVLDAEQHILVVLYRNAVDHATRELKLPCEIESEQFRAEVARQWERQLYRSFNTSNPMELASELRSILESPICSLFAGYWNTSSRLFSLVPKAASEFQAGDAQKGATTLATLETGLYIASIIRQAMIREAKDDPALAGARRQFMAKLAELLPLYGQRLEPAIRKAFAGIQASPDAGTELWENLAAIFESARGTINVTTDWILGRDNLETAFDGLLRIAGLGLTSLAIPISGPSDLAQRFWNGSLTPGLDPPIKERDFVAMVRKLE
jgi:hypothetical protein